MNWRSVFSFPEIVVAILLALPTAAVSYKLAHWEPLYGRPSAQDIWFDADTDRVYSVETNRHGHNDRTTLHPIYPFIVYPPMLVVRTILHSSEKAVRVWHAGVAGAWIALLFLLLRRVGIRRPDAVLVSLVALSSSSAFFWLPHPETFVLGSISMIPPLMLNAGERPGGVIGHLLASIFAIGITVTNWMVAVFASLVDLGWKKAIAVAVAAIAVATLFGEAHRLVFPKAVKMFRTAGGEAAYMWAPETGGPWAIIRAFFFHAMVAPEISFKVNWRHDNWPLMSMQYSGLLTGVRGWACAATLAWSGLLAAGLAALVGLKEHARLRCTLALTILYQLLLHLLYGRETFLYVIHFLPMFLVCVALATRTRWRPVVLVLSTVLCVTASVNNYRQFQWSHGYVMRGDRLQEKQSPQHKRLGVPLDKSDPTWNYRFWRDILHWAPPLEHGWDTEMFK